jgi:hypothetical protein
MSARSIELGAEDVNGSGSSSAGGSSSGRNGVHLRAMSGGQADLAGNVHLFVLGWRDTGPAPRPTDSGYASAPVVGLSFASFDIV